jgi:hypothetical protein
MIICASFFKFFFFSYVGVKAPGIATRTTFFPGKMSLVEIGVGLESTSERNVNSGTLSPS